MGYRIFLDSFSGALADLKRGQRTTENALAVLKKSPMVSTWDMSENKWLWRLVCDLKEAGLIIELEQPYPWHRYALTDKGMALLPPNVKWTAYAPPILSLRRPFWIERWDQGIAGIEQILVSDASSPG